MLLLELGPKKPKTGHLGPKMMMVSMELAADIVKLGPKKPKTGHLGPKMMMVSMKIAVHIANWDLKS